MLQRAENLDNLVDRSDDLKHTAPSTHTHTYTEIHTGNFETHQVLQRGENLDNLVDRTDDLRDQAHKFQRQGTQLRQRMW